MSEDTDVVCFTCGQSIGRPLRVNTLRCGAPCPSCRDRVLEALPSLLPGGGAVREDEAVESGLPGGAPDVLASLSLPEGEGRSPDDDPPLRA